MKGKNGKGQMPSVVKSVEERGAREMLVLLHGARNDNKGNVDKL